MTTDQLRVLLADDDPVLREAMRTVFSRHEEIDLVAVVSNGAEAVKVASERLVDIVLLDVDMPVLDGIEAAKEILRDQPRMTIVMLTAFESEDSLGRALAAGARGFITKDLDIEQTIPLLWQAKQGVNIMSHRPTQILTDFYRKHTLRLQEDQPFVQAVEAFPGHLREVFNLTIHAAPNRTIAEKLGLSESTVRTYVSQILNKTGCSSRAELAVRAGRAGYE